MLPASIDAGVRIAEERGVAVMDTPIGTEEHAIERAVGAIQDGGEDFRAHGIADMPDKQSAAIIATESLGQRTSYLERVMDTSMSLETCQWADNRAQCASEHVLEQLRAAEEQAFFEEGHLSDRLTVRSR